MSTDTATVEVIRTTALDGVAHGFLGRRGGISSGLHGGLNVGLGSDDDPAAIEENRRRATDAVLPGAILVTCYQIHSADCITVAEPPTERPRGDALVTDRPGIALSILTADCAPVLLADTSAGIVGAAHAGWKGAVGGVLDSTLERMEQLGARRAHIVAAIGPLIRQPSYEVGPEFVSTLTALDHANIRFFAPSDRAHHAMFDLPGYIRARLENLGVLHIDDLGLDTYADEARFYSFRRATHRGEPDYGRLIAAITLV